MSQRRSFSFLEVVTGRIVGYTCAVFLQLWLYPIYGFDVTVNESLQLALIFTSVSILISFCIRRFFNYLHTKGIGVVKKD